MYEKTVYLGSPLLVDIVVDDTVVDTLAYYLVSKEEIQKSHNGSEEDMEEMEELISKLREIVSSNF